MKKIVIHIENSKDFYGGYAENSEGIYDAGGSVKAVKGNIQETIRLLKEHNSVENLLGLLEVKNLRLEYYSV